MVLTLKKLSICRRWVAWPVVALVLAGISGCGPSDAQAPATPVMPEGYLSAGAGTVVRADREAFSQSMPPVQADFALDAVFKQGNFIFRGARKGAGPLVNNNICQGCHIKDGRGVLPEDETQPMAAMLFQLSLGQDADGEDLLDLNYGPQLQTLSIHTSGELIPATHADNELPAEAFPFVRYEPIHGQYPDGTAYELRKPVYFFKNLAYGDFGAGARLSPRMASPMIGLGLLEAIPQQAITALADPEDSDGNGISGMARWVKDPTQGEQVLGRFGWKAGSGSVLHQTSKALVNDMGITTRFFPDEPCTAVQVACLTAAGSEPGGADRPDMNDVALASVEFYARTLAVPARRGINPVTGQWLPEVARGETLFQQAQCAACHTPRFTTGEFRESMLGSVRDLALLEKTGQSLAALDQQTIFPYTDLLLHDMGGQCEALARESEQGEVCESGESCYWVQRCEGLADGKNEGSASGSEWRTPPLWGLGLTHILSPGAGFLHDGRARTIEEAILWHDGEAAASREHFMALPAKDRQAMLSFLQSL